MTTLSLHDVTVGAFAKPLTGLSWVLCKADAHYRAEGKDTAQLMSDTLAPDMFPFGMQVALAVQQSAGALERTIGRADLPMRPYATLAEARKAVEDALARIKTITPADLEAAADRKINWDPRGDGVGFSYDGAKAYLVDFATPNFWFHVTTAYAIVRKNGVAIGKADFTARGDAPEGLAA